MWKPIDTQSFVEWDAELVSQIETYLSEKETDLAHEMIGLIPTIEGETAKPHLDLPSEEELTIADAIETLAKKIRAIHSSPFQPLSSEGWQAEIRKMNQAFWEYIEVLEGAVTELFHQVHFIGIEKWKVSLFQGVTSVKEILIRRIDNVSWAVRRLENHLKEYRYICESRIAKGYFWKQWVIWWQPVLDPALLINLTKSEKFCKNSYNEFAHYYEGYQKLAKEVEDYGKKFTSFRILSQGDPRDVKFFTSLCNALHLWERNQRQKALPQNYAILALKRIARPDAAFQLFLRYNKKLRETIFARSRELKKKKRSPQEEETVKKKLQDELILYRKEVRTLMNTSAKYRDFLLRTDPDPYVRSRWGFTEWIVGPEPPMTRKFLNLAYETKELRSLLDSFIKSLSEPSPSFVRFKRGELYQNVEYILHEMAQPLNTEEMMQRRSEILLGYLEACKEVDSTNWGIVDYVGDVLRRAFRDDWKYHVLQAQPAFQNVYAVHSGITGPVQEESHQIRKKQFTKQISRIQEITKKGENLVLHEDLEEVIHDMRADLQDFLGSVQQLVHDPKKKERLHDVQQRLLEYRVLFGNFLHEIGKKTLDGQPMRTAFFFIDQYFEFVEKILDDIV